jgi:hypothetical protein
MVCDEALLCLRGAISQTSPNLTAALASRSIPSAWIPSSFVIKIVLDM